VPKIVFFNHYHRGDIFTNRGYVVAIKESLPNFEFGYQHYNHPKLTRDISIRYEGEPVAFNKKERFKFENDCLYINTWMGSYKKIMKKHGGLNMSAMHEQWSIIFEEINKTFNVNLKLSSKKVRYLPDIDPALLSLSNIKDYLDKNQKFKKIIICNGAPKSAQSFQYDMSQQINALADEFPEIHFICTTKISSTNKNVLFTDDIIKDEEEEQKRAPWEDRVQNNCDLLEISYLSQYCNLIVGKNSGPFCFCETGKNYLDETKHFLSFNVSWGIGTLDSESMSYDLPLACKYTRVPISSVENISDLDMKIIYDNFKHVIKQL
jgi:hypothetical protein